MAIKEKWLRKIDGALLDGARLHMFRSGGGLRVVRLETDRLAGYGEHPHADGALVHAAIDYRAGGRGYNAVYGKQRPSYWTGEASSTSPLDAEILRGNTCDAFERDGKIVVEVRGYGRTAYPIGYTERATAGETLRFESRGYTYEIGPVRYCNGERGCQCRVVNGPDRGGAAPWMFKTVKTGIATTFAEALAASLAADAVEVDGEARS